jgi:hypothetical protein
VNFPLISGEGGYNVDQVDVLLTRIADELDAGGSPRAVIASSTLSRERKELLSYRTDVVDSYLEDLRREDPAAGDIWQRGPVSNWLINSRPADGWRPAELLSSQCDEEWQRFLDLPGTHLWLSFPRSGGHRS